MKLQNMSATIQDIKETLAKGQKFLLKLKPLLKMKKIKLVKNEKYPIKGQSWKSQGAQHTDIDASKFNVGIPTGRINNLIVLDIDIKKESKKELDGVAKMRDYIEQHQDINTLTIKTPSGGTHYYFKYNDSNENIKFIVKNYLYTRSGVGGYSIDVRADNGYIVAPPSSINGNAYEITNYAEISHIPETLANFLKGLDDEKDRDKADKLNKK